MNNEQHKKLNMAALLFVGVAVAVMVFQYIAGPGYKTSNANMLEKATQDERWILPHELNQLIENDRLQNYQLVDLRTREEYNRGTLPGAINIPFESLLHRKSLKQLKGRKPVIVFSSAESQASVAGLLLYGKGIENVMVIANDYTWLKENVLELLQPSHAFTRGEKARYDYQRFLRATPQPVSTPTSIQPRIPEVQVVSVEGGC